jgi:hypothetical protein
MMLFLSSFAHTSSAEDSGDFDELDGDFAGIHLDRFSSTQGISGEEVKLVAMRD